MQIHSSSAGLYEHGQKLLDLMLECGHDFGDLSGLKLPQPPPEEPLLDPLSPAVFIPNNENFFDTSLPPHSGHLIRFFSVEDLKSSSNTLSHGLQ